MNAFITTGAFLLDLLSLRRLCLLYFFFSPFFVTQGETIPIELIYGIGYLFSTPVMLLGFCVSVPKMFDPVEVSGTTLAAIGLFALSLVSVAVNVPEFLISPYCYYTLYFKLFSSMACFFILTHTLNEKDLSALYSLLIVLALAGAAAMPFFFLHDIGNYGNPLEWRYEFFFDDGNSFACFLAIVTGMTFPALVSKYMARQKLRTFAIINIILVVEIFATGSRGAMLIVLITFTASVFPTRNRRLITISMGLLAFLTFMAGLLFFIRYAFTRAEYSDFARILTYQFAWSIIQERPFFGIGFGNFLSAFEYSYPSYLVLLMRTFMVIHNGPLGMAVEIGVPGVLCWLALIGIPAHTLFWRVKENSSRFYPTAEIAGFNVLTVFFLTQLYLPYSILQDFFWAYLAFPFIVLRTVTPDNHSQLEFRFTQSGSESARAREGRAAMTGTAALPG